MAKCQAGQSTALAFSSSSPSLVVVANNFLNTTQRTMHEDSDEEDSENEKAESSDSEGDSDSDNYNVDCPMNAFAL
jgi:hypothetical protein